MTDIQAVCDEPTARGVEVGNQRWRHDNGEWIEGVHPMHANSMSFAEFKDAGGKLWLLQERDFQGTYGR